MSLTDDLEAAAPVDRPGLKARAMAALADLDGAQFRRGQVTATLVNPHLEGGDFVCSLILMRAGRDVTPADLNPITLRPNDAPHMAIYEDPDGPISRTWKRRDGTEITKTYRVDVRRFLIDWLLEVLR